MNIIPFDIIILGLLGYVFGLYSYLSIWIFCFISYYRHLLLLVVYHLKDSLREIKHAQTFRVMTEE